MKGNRLIKVHISMVLNHSLLLQREIRPLKGSLIINLEDLPLDSKRKEEEVVRIINLIIDLHQKGRDKLARLI
jgi:hypothetical protein